MGVERENCVSSSFCGFCVLLWIIMGAVAVLEIASLGFLCIQIVTMDTLLWDAVVACIALVDLGHRHVDSVRAGASL